MSHDMGDPALQRRHLEAVQRLYELAQALLNDFDTFEKVVEKNTDISKYAYSYLQKNPL